MLLNSLSPLFAIVAGAVALSENAVLNVTYDYIIVGGGTSGLTVANRLTENGKRTSHAYLQRSTNLRL
jgi:ribulose 1,5-bisphosphate synthetase/thiazole synthase